MLTYDFAWLNSKQWLSRHCVPSGARERRWKRWKRWKRWFLQNAERTIDVLSTIYLLIISLFFCFLLLRSPSLASPGLALPSLSHSVSAHSCSAISGLVHSCSASSCLASLLSPVFHFLVFALFTFAFKRSPSRFNYELCKTAQSFGTNWRTQCQSQ